MFHVGSKIAGSCILSVETSIRSSAKLIDLVPSDMIRVTIVGVCLGVRPSALWLMRGKGPPAEQKAHQPACLTTERMNARLVTTRQPRPPVPPSPKSRQITVAIIHTRRRGAFSLGNFPPAPWPPPASVSGLPT